MRPRAAGFPRMGRAISRAGIVHIAAHGSFRGGNALLSTVNLHDGPVTGEELAACLHRARLTVLSCCDSGLADASGVGLSRLLNQISGSAVIASVSPVSDQLSPEFMGQLHSRLAVGERPASALARARQALRSSPSFASAAGFICFGDV